ncbi:cell division protein FtsZ [Cetobacterium somerae]|uniref:cell division protein FtsZ n=1 Tax=Cetobacterium sp. NK01 TaxID=2993530 RepID=UPI002115EB7B|nr:cell division protein FtsZ [Cetobacterium sp. NK01]MCQ8212430.1 cell division protein FtsZ [Cetobacterium sp. NK01]
MGDKFNVNIKVMGIGGGGINAIDEIVTSEIDGVNFFALNTDLQDLNNSKTPHKIQLGISTTKGLGCGGNIELGEKAIKESLPFIKNILRGTDFLFLTSTMGGGTGSAATALIAKLAKEMNILTVAIVTKPFSFEGKRRMKIAEAGIKNLKPFVDSLIVVPNDKLLDNSSANITVQEAFKKSNFVLYTAVKGMTDLMLAKGLINLDFADIKSLLLESGEAILGFGEGSGENRSEKAALAAVDSSLFERTILGATKFLVNIIGPKDLNLIESSIIVETIKKECEGEIDDVLFGVSIDEDSDDNIKVILIANSFFKI